MKKIPRVVLSPFTGKEMEIVLRPQKITYKGIEINVDLYSYYCQESGETFTLDEIDENNIKIIKQEHIKHIRNEKIKSIGI